MKPLARGGDFWSGLVLAALGAWIVSEAHGWDYMTDEGPGPGFFPMWYGSLMVVLSLVLVARTAFGRTAHEAKPQPNWTEIRRALTCWAAFVAAVALMNVLGFAVSFALLTWFIVAVMARRPQRITIPVAIGFMILIALLFAALGVIFGSSLQDMQGFQLIMNFLVLPIYFLSGAMFPLTNQGKILGFITALDPLSYGIDGMRSVLLNAVTFHPAFGISIDLAVLIFVGTVLLILGAWRFSKIEA